MRNLSDLKTRLLADPETRVAYDEMADEFNMARESNSRAGEPVSMALQKKKPAMFSIAGFPCIDWCRRDESNTRPSHYE